MFTVLPSHLVFSSLHKTMMIESPSHTEGLEFRHGRTKHKCEAKGLVTSGSERLINNLINQNQNEPENVPTSPGRQALYIRGVRDFFPSPPHSHICQVAQKCNRGASGLQLPKYKHIHKRRHSDALILKVESFHFRRGVG